MSTNYEHKGVNIRITKKSGLWVLWKLWFPKADWRRMFVALGRCVSTPDGTIPEDVWVHERTHLEQQKFSYLRALWWHLKYRLSAEFRYSQELPAYKRQLDWINSQPIPLKDKHGYRKKVAEMLSGPMYGYMKEYDEAFKDLGANQK